MSTIRVFHSLSGNRPMLRRQAFTLIEMLMALALSTVIMLTLYMGFRATLGGLQAANRVALENDLMRKGYLAILDEADFWRFYDNPDGDPHELAAGRGLRGDAGDTTFTRSDILLSTGSKKQGMAFTPLRNAQDVVMFTDNIQVFTHTPWAAAPVPTAVPGDASQTYLPLDPATSFDAAARDDERGWRAGYHWSAADPRTWFRGCLEQGDNSDLRWGRYALFSHVRSSPTLGNTLANQYSHNSWGLYSAPTTGAFGAVTVDHTWRDNQLLGLRFALGHYGMADYLPSNVILGTHGATSWENGGGPNGGIAQNNNDEGAFKGWFSFLGLDWGWGTMRGGIIPHFQGTWPVHARGEMFPMLARSRYALWNHAAGSEHGTAAWDLWWFIDESTRAFSMQASNPGGGYWNWARYSLASTEVLRPMLFQHPDSWPEVYLGSSRGFMNAAFFNNYRVRLAEPIMGTVREFTFACYGTTLRGARQQRRYEPGVSTTDWAVWRGPGNAANSPTLDDY
jgi:prepilin-type N-terminal cleavage/methylation domain-containing protein